MVSMSVIGPLFSMPEILDTVSYCICNGSIRTDGVTCWPCVVGIRVRSGVKVAAAFVCVVVLEHRADGDAPHACTEKVLYCTQL